jgi:hypothetical protein
MSETVRIRDEDYEAISAAKDVLGLSFPDALHLSLNTDVLKGSPRQNARRAIQYYYTYIVEEYDNIHEVPVEDLSFDGTDQAKAGLTIGAEKHESRLEKPRPDSHNER